jgi:hypothetical protein
MPEKTAIKQGRYDFSDEEKRDIAARLSESVRKHDELDAEKKASAKQIALRIEENDKQIRDLAHLYKQGHEYREYECNVLFDYELGEKRYVRESDGEVLERGFITADEWADYRQTKLALEQESEEEADEDNPHMEIVSQIDEFNPFAEKRPGVRVV